MHNVKYNSDVIVFIHEENISKYINIYIKVVENSFNNIKTIRIEKLTDPETGEEKVLFTPDVSGEIKDIQDDYNKYIEAITEKIKLNIIPIEISYMICLHTNIII